jgi:hypothetical protein
MGIGSWWKTSLNSYSHLMRAKSSRGLESKRRIEGSIRLQEDRTMQHSKRNSETVIEMTGGADLLERRRVAKDLAWKAKWVQEQRNSTEKQRDTGIYSGSHNCHR